MKQWLLITGTLSTLLLSACSQVSSSNNTQVYISDGYVQCEAKAQSIAITQSQLEQAGVKVLKSECAQISEQATIAMCGAGGPGIHVLTVNRYDVTKAEQLGFAEVTELDQQGLQFNRISCEE
ncbi:hypothetical protein [Motilimonas pumila]|uniref:DUF4156 domain-containing protein n=1 Tax=Motilimonas pumila TaxID=2303987 RepID=A0A418YH95_9GAMM|nr:hypothetical protein [Motilimonas pumila]RJG49472.1 hypothetical protein D1Z90_05810 [Motilimonas pumila]